MADPNLLMRMWCSYRLHITAHRRGRCRRVMKRSETWSIYVSLSFRGIFSMLTWQQPERSVNPLTRCQSSCSADLLVNHEFAGGREGTLSFGDFTPNTLSPHCTPHLIVLAPPPDTTQGNLGRAKHKGIYQEEGPPEDSPTRKAREGFLGYGLRDDGAYRTRFMRLEYK
jgi:hypothetical protein